MNMPYRWRRLCAAILFVTIRSAQGADSVSFAVIGDYGLSGTAESNVASLVKGWYPEFIVTAGDNNYPSGSASTIDANIGQYYHDYIFPYGGAYGAGAASNNFYPVPGNHDWMAAGAQPYFSYFTLPGNERYYDVVRGPVQFFMLDSDTHEPDGYTSSSTQALWLQGALASSTARWKIVVCHHAPYSSGSVHGSTAYMQWPFREWGASAVISGHEHTYERVLQDSIPYFVNGLGGDSRYSFTTPVAGSQVRYSADYGAMRVEATEEFIAFEFVTRAGAVVDTYTLLGAAPLRVSFQPFASDIPEGFVLGDDAAYGFRGNYGWR